MRIKRKTAGIGAVLFVAAFIRYSDIFANVTAIFVYVLMLLFVLSPSCRRLERAGLSSAAASALMSAVVLIAFIILLLFILPFLVIHAARIAARCTPAFRSAIEYIENTFVVNGYPLFRITELAENLIAYAGKLAQLFVRGSMSAAAGTGRILFSVVIAYYALKERVTLAYHLQLMVPTRFRNPTILTLKAGRNAVMGYLSGQLKTCLFVGCATCIGLLCIGMSDAFLLGVLMGVLEIVPYIGPLLGSLPILLSAASMGISKMLVAGALVFLIQQIESSLVGPYFASSSTSVHPMAVLLSVYIFGSLFNFWGVLLAVPCLLMIQCGWWSFVRFRNAMNT